MQSRFNIEILYFVYLEVFIVKLLSLSTAWGRGGDVE